MWTAKLLIAAGVVGVMTFCFVVVYGAEGFFQIRTTGHYVPPQDLIDILKLTIGASVFVLTLGGVSEYKRLTKGEVPNDQTAEKNCGCDSGCQH